MYEVFVPWLKTTKVWHVRNHVEWLRIKGMKSTWILSKDIDEDGYHTGMVFQFENADDAIRFRLERR